MMASAAGIWRNCFVAFSWQRAMPVFVGIAVGVSLIVASLRLGSAGISGFVETDYLLIETEDALTTTDLGARNLRLVGLASLKLPGGELLSGEGLALSIGDDGREDSRTSIPPFKIGAGSQVSLEVNREEKRLSLTVKAKELSIRLIPWPGAQVQIDGASCSAQPCSLSFQGSSPLYATAGENIPLEMRMDLDGAPKTFTDRVAVSAVQLWELEHLQGTVERRGAVKSGSFRLLEAPQQIEPLDRGAVVDIKPAGLVLRALEFRDESVYLQLSGQVGAIAVEIGDAGYSLMPTWFDLLSRDSRVQLGLGILTFLLSGGLTLIQRLSRSPPSTNSGSEEAPSLGSPRKGSQSKRSPIEKPLSQEFPPEQPPIRKASSRETQPEDLHPQIIDRRDQDS